MASLNVLTSPEPPLPRPYPIVESTLLMLAARKTLSVAGSQRTAALLLFSVGCAFVAWIARLNFVMHDMYHEMALVREALVHGALPLDNPFAFTPTVYPSVHHEWAMGLLLYGYCVSTGWGLYGLTVLRWMLIVGIAAATYMNARRRGADPIVFAAIAILILPIAWVGFGTLRAQLVTLLFTAIQLRLMDEDRNCSRGWVLLLIPLWVIWVNIHAGFLVGAGLLLLDTCERIVSDLAGQWQINRCRRRRSLVRITAGRYWHRIGLLIAGGATLGLTPYGIMYGPFVIHAVGLARPEIAEWGPLWTTVMPELTMVAYVAILTVTAVAVHQLGLRRSLGVISLMVTAYLALRHIRHGSIFGVVWLCYAPAVVSQSAIGRNLRDWVLLRQRVVSRAAVSASLFSVAMFLYCGGWYTYVPVQSESMNNQPAGVVEYLQENRFRGKVMTPFGAGAYFMWHMYPDVLISMDGRYEVGYPPELLDEHRAFYRGETNWQQMLDRYPCDVVVVPSHSPVKQAMRKSPEWHVVYQDDSFVLMASPEAHQSLPMQDRRGEVLPQKFL